MLVVTCPGCQSKLKMKPSLAGRKVKCPKCQTTVQVPRATAAAEPETTKAAESSAATVEPQRQSDPVPLTLVSVPDPPAASIADAPPQTEMPVSALNLDTRSSAPTSTRRRRSSVGIWLPMLLVLIGAAAALWHFMPAEKPHDVVVKDFGDQKAVEGKAMKLVMPVGSSGNSQTVEFRIVKAPPGATLDTGTREFTWTPTEADGPGVFDVTVHVVQGPATVEAIFRIIVSEEDKPPVFDAIQTVAAKPLVEVIVALKAKDPDEPAVPLTYSLVDSVSDVVTGASVNVQTGQLSWTPPELTAGEIVTLKVAATELSDAALSTQQQISIQVAEFDDPVRQLAVELRKLEIDVETVESSTDTSALPFTGRASTLKLNGHEVTAFRYDSESLRQDDVTRVDEIGGKVFDAPWENAKPLNVFAKDSLLVASVGGEDDVLALLSSLLDRPVAVVQRYAAPVPIVKQTPVLVAALKPLYEERVKRIGRPRKLFTTDSYKEVRAVFADQFAETHDAEIRAGLGDDYDEVMTWFEERVDLKEELFTAIRPEFDDVTAALRVFNEIRKEFPKQIDQYGSLAIATAVVWDRDRGVYKYGGHAKRTHSTMPDTLLAGLENFRYFVEAEIAMQGRAQFVPWEFLTHLVNHQTPVPERVWAVQTYLPTRQMFGKCYSEVPYDKEMLATKSRVCRLDGREYNLPNLRQFGGVCAMQADFAARVGKSMGVPAAYVSGQGRYGGSHAWVMWVELQAVSQRSIRFTLESHGRYRGDHYYIGNLNDPQSGKRITDRILELRLQQVGMDAMAKRHADRLMALYPQMAEELAFDFETHLDYLSGAVGLNPWSETAWTALSQLATDRDIGKAEHKTMTVLLNQLFVNFAAFPDFTLTIFDNLTSFEKDEAKRVPYYYQLLEVYAAAKRPDLAFQGLLKLSDLLERQKRSGEAIQALAVAIQKYPEEGQYVPRMLDRLEGLASTVGEADQTLAEFYAVFLPKVPQQRGTIPSQYCIDVYERAVPIFERAGQQQLAQTYQTGALQMRDSLPK